MKKVYVVTSGSYSNYGINAIFSTKELAESYMKLYGGYNSFNDVDEWDVDLDIYTELIKSNRKPYKVIMRKNGDVDEIEQISIYHTFDIHKLNTPKYIFYWLQQDDGGVMVVSCVADSEDHAVKIAGEIRSQVLINNLWGTDKRKD